MASNSGGYYPPGGAGDPARAPFRRTTGKVAMDGPGSQAPPYQQLYYPEDHQQQYHGSAVPAPHDPQYQQAPGGYYSYIAPPSPRTLQQQQPQWQNRPYYQQASGTTLHGQSDDGSVEGLDLYTEHKLAQQQQQQQQQQNSRPSSNRRVQPDSAVHSDAYAGQMAQMTGSFQQMGVGPRHPPPHGAHQHPPFDNVYDDSYHARAGSAPTAHTDLATSHYLHASGNGSGMSTGTNSPAPGGRPYVYGDGFDSSSDQLHMNGGRAMPPQQRQYPPQSHGSAVPSPFVASGAPQPHHLGEQGPPPPPLPPAGYSHGDSGSIYGAAPHDGSTGSDGMGPLDPPLQPHPGMRPWTASSRSLPLAAPSPHFAEQSRPTSSASSSTGVPPMGMHPSANAAPASPPKAPTPTIASLEAYRKSIRRSNDPAAQLEFAKYVLEHARGIADNEPNSKLAKRRYDTLTEEGLKWVRKLAGGGITVHRTNIAAEAQYFLGTVHSRGIYGVTRDDNKAFSYYQQASKSQHAEANYRTAVCYEVGVGTRKDAARALQFYRKAGAQSNVPAMYKLGLILIKGLLGVTASPREGINWLKRGADSATPECPHSLHELALCHESSDIPGVIQDESYSRQLYIKAGKLGYVPSQVRLGQAYEYGTLGCPVDPRRSIGWYTRAAEKNDPDSELALSGWYLTGADPFLPQNDVEAYLWARRAADRGLAKAEYAVGYYYECGIGVARPDVNEAQKWYTRAAHKQNRRAMLRLKELKQMGVNVVPPSRASRPRRGKGSMF
ncbi:hypothetical protein GGF46_004625 [Coemansia sp. RSA 552]|nr:hypothetical protein GGF46_004625 [Coemansia sp. RSA 552]